MDMVIDRKLVLKERNGENVVYPSQYYYLELNTARMLCELNILCPEDEQLVRKRIELIEKETGTVLDEMQKKAVTEAASHGLFILTGGRVQVRLLRSMPSYSFSKERVQSFGLLRLPDVLRRG